MRGLLALVLAVSLGAGTGCVTGWGTTPVGNQVGDCQAGDTCRCATGNCDLDCVGGGCVFECSGTSNCQYSCPEGGCQALCENQGNCLMDCAGDGCTMECQGVGNCYLEGCGDGCELVCEGTGNCQML